jgi:type I restriction enzyme R subunit
VGVFRDLQKALAIYAPTPGAGGDTPVKSKADLIEVLRTAIAEATTFCAERGIRLEKLLAAQGFQRVKLLDDAVEAILANDESKRRYRLLAEQVARIFKAIKPDPLVNEFLPICTVLAVIAEKIRSLAPTPDISEVLAEVERLLDASIEARGYLIKPEAPLDLSTIDFEKLRARFEQGKKRAEAERLRGAVSNKLQQMVRLNRTRIDYLEKFQHMIDEYNAGSVNIEEFFKQLVTFTQGLNAEEKRGIAENLTEEELAIFDLLTKPAMTLTKKDEQAVKKTAKDLLATLKKERLVLDWRKRQQTRAAVRLSVETVLDQALPETYPRDVYLQKCEAVYQHIYDSYFGPGQSVYATAPRATTI